MKTRLTEDSGVKFPIICGAMYPCSNPELIAAAANGGGMAIIQPVSLTVVHGYDKPDLNQGLINGIREIRCEPYILIAIVVKVGKRNGGSLLNIAKAPCRSHVDKVRSLCIA